MFNKLLSNLPFFYFCIIHYIFQFFLISYELFPIRLSKVDKLEIGKREKGKDLNNSNGKLKLNIKYKFKSKKY